MADAISRFARSIELIQASARVLRSDSELLVLPVLSGIASAIAIAGFVGAGYAAGIMEMLKPETANGELPLWFYGVLLAFYFVLYFVIYFFNTALVAGALVRLSGGNPTLGECLAVAVSRIGVIAGYAFISATLGLLLRMIAERLGFIGRLIETGVGLAWTIATFLVVPVLAVEGVGPLQAVRRSSSLLRETWGENIIGNGGIGIATGILAAAIMAIGGAGSVKLAEQGNIPVAIAIGAVSLILLAAVIVVSTALAAVYSSALYYFAATGDTPKGFEKNLVGEAFIRKPNAV